MSWINQYDRQGKTPLLRAIDYEGGLPRVMELVEAGANVNQPERGDRSGGDTPLSLAVMHAVLNGNIDIVQYLISKGADVNKPRPYLNYTPLQVAVSIYVESYIANGRPLDVVKEEVRAAKAASTCRVVDLLLDAGADIESPGPRDSPLILAIQIGHIEVVNKLISRGANVNASRGADNTPLHKACQSGRANLVATLLDNGASLSQAEAEPHTVSPIWFACYNMSPVLVRLLIDRGAAVDNPVRPSRYRYPGVEGTTPLTVAALFGPPENVDMLLNAGASPDFIITDNHLRELNSRKFFNAGRGGIPVDDSPFSIINQARRDRFTPDVKAVFVKHFSAWGRRRAAVMAKAAYDATQNNNMGGGGKRRKRHTRRRHRARK